MSKSHLGVGYLMHPMEELPELEDPHEGSALLPKGVYSREQNLWNLRDIVRHKPSWLQPTASGGLPENDGDMTVLLVLNAMIGVGILNQPEVFKDSGILAATVMYVLAGAGVYSGSAILVEVGEYKGALSYNELAEVAYPRFGSNSVNAAIALMSFGALISLLIVMGELGSEILQSWTGDSQWAVNSSFVTVALVLIFVLPVCLVRQLGHLVWVSALSISAIFVVLVLVVFAAPFQDTSSRSDPLNWFEPLSAVTSMGSIVFAFSYASITFHAYTCLRPRTPAMWRKVTFKATCLGTGMCYVMGLAGYLSFRDDTDGDILSNFSWSLVAGVKLLVVCHLVCALPIDFVVMRHALLRLCGLDSDQIVTSKFIGITIVLLTCVTGAVVLLLTSGLSSGDAFSVTVDITGGIAGSYICFVLPGLIPLKLGIQKGFRPLLLVIFGIVVALSVIVAFIIDLA